MDPIFNQTDYQKFVLQNPNVRNHDSRVLPPPFELKPAEKSKKAKKDVEKEKKQSKKDEKEDQNQAE